MAFIRTKKIKGNEYAYIVENQWKKRGKKVKQKTKKYLGRVYRFEIKQDVGFFEFHTVSDEMNYVESKKREDIIVDLVRWELARHGFKQEKSGKLFNEDCVFRVKDRKIVNSRGNKIALAFNEGFLSSYAIAKLINFKAEYEEDAYDLAKIFVEAGIEIPQEIFVGIFGKFEVEPSTEDY